MCEMTGESGLTFKMALASEEKAGSSSGDACAMPCCVCMSSPLQAHLMHDSIYALTNYLKLAFDLQSACRIPSWDSI